MNLDPLEVLTSASALFGEQLTLVGDEDWHGETSVQDWDVRSLVAHLVIGDAAVTEAVTEGSATRVTSFDPAILGTEPLVVWRGTALAMIRAFSEPGALDRVYEFDRIELDGRALLGFRVSDALVHGWEVARSIGNELDLPDKLAVYALDFWMGLTTGLSDAQFHGAGPIQPPEDASAGIRLLCLMGRT